MGVMPLKVKLVCKYINTMDKNQEKPTKSENNRERFKRLASLRTNAVLKRLKVLGNCSNRSIYEYTEDDLDKIFSEIEKKVIQCRIFKPIA